MSVNNLSSFQLDNNLSSFSVLLKWYNAHSQTHSHTIKTRTLISYFSVIDWKWRYIYNTHTHTAQVIKANLNTDTHQHHLKALTTANNKKTQPFHISTSFSIQLGSYLLFHLISSYFNQLLHLPLSLPLP